MVWKGNNKKVKVIRENSKQERIIYEWKNRKDKGDKKKKTRYRKMKIKELGEIVQTYSIHLRYGQIKLYVITGIDRINRYVYAKYIKY